MAGISETLIRLHLRHAREGLQWNHVVTSWDVCSCRFVPFVTVAFAAGSGPRNTIKAWMKRTDPSYPMVLASLPEKAFHRNEQDASTVCTNTQ